MAIILKKVKGAKHEKELVIAGFDFGRTNANG